MPINGIAKNGRRARDEGVGHHLSVTTWDRILDIGAVSAAFRETFRFPVREPANMAHAASGLVARQIGSLFDGGSAAGLSDRQLLDRFVARAMPPAKPRSLRWWPGTERWSYTSAASFLVTTSMPRMHSRLSSSC